MLRCAWGSGGFWLLEFRLPSRAVCRTATIAIGREAGEGGGPTFSASGHNSGLALKVVGRYNVTYYLKNK